MLKPLVAIVAILALAGCGASGSSSGTTGVGGRKAPVSAATAAKELAAFAVFRRSARPMDQIPAEQAVGGRRPHPSRLAYSGRLGQLYAYVHDGLLCVSYEAAVSASRGAGVGRCDALAAARGLGVVLSLPATFDRLDRVAALLPDGVRTVTITRAGAAPATLLVAGNTVVYAATGLRGYAFRTASGVREAQPLSSGAPPAGKR